MAKIKCLIVDDEPKAREVLDIYIQDATELQLIAHCKNAIEAINIMANQKIDLIFLDIEMPEISGLALAKSINQETSIVFTTAFRDYAVDAFDLSAVDYLLKPIRPDRFKEAIEKYKTHKLKDAMEVSASSKSGYFYVRADRKMVKVLLHEILYIESFSDYLKIHTTKGVIITRETMSKLMEELPTHQFIRIHRSYTINTDHILSFTKESVQILEQELPISRPNRNVVHEQLTQK